MGQMQRPFCSTDIFLELCIISRPYMFEYSSTIHEHDLCTCILQSIQHMLIDCFNEIIIPNFKANEE